MYPPPAHLGEPDPLATVTAELERLAGGRALPMDALTDRARSTAHLARPWRPARIEIRREIEAQGRSDALRGERAHVLSADFRVRGCAGAACSVVPVWGRETLLLCWVLGARARRRRC